MSLFKLYTKETHFPLGFVADFCPIERKITAARIVAVHASRYLTFIRLDRGSLLRHDRVCCSCGLNLAGENQAYVALAPAPTLDLAALEQSTNPGVSERNRVFIELHRDIARGVPVARELKTALLKEQFALLDQIAAVHWRGETKLDRTSLGVGLGSIALAFVALVVSTKLPTEQQRLDALPYLGAVILLLVIASAVVFFLGPRRAVASHVLPIMAVALRPLHPSRAELEALLQEMRTEGFHYATKVKPEQLLKLLSR